MVSLIADSVGVNRNFSRRTLDIGVDIDHVLYSWVNAVAECLVEAGYDSSLMTPPTQWLAPHMWGVPDEEFWEVVRKGVEDRKILWKGEPTPGAKESLDSLLAAGHRIHMITDRQAFADTAEEATKAWLAEHDLNYTTLTFSRDKTARHTDVFIDDKPENILSLAAVGTVAWLDDGTHNRGFEWPFRVWGLPHFAALVLGDIWRPEDWNEDPRVKAFFEGTGQA